MAMKIDIVFHRICVGVQFTTACKIYGGGLLHREIGNALEETEDAEELTEELADHFSRRQKKEIRL